MQNFTCTKCGSMDVFIDDRGVQKALCCGDCGAWLRWISKKDLPLVKRFIESNKNTVEPIEDFIKMEIKIKSKDVSKLVEFLKQL